MATRTFAALWMTRHLIIRVREQVGAAAPPPIALFPPSPHSRLSSWTRNEWRIWWPLQPGYYHLNPDLKWEHEPTEGSSTKAVWWHLQSGKRSHNSNSSHLWKSINLYYCSGMAARSFAALWMTRHLIIRVREQVGAAAPHPLALFFLFLQSLTVILNEARVKDLLALAARLLSTESSFKVRVWTNRRELDESSLVVIAVG